MNLDARSNVDSSVPNATCNLNTTLYIYEMGSSYTWCNLTRVIHFLHCRFLLDLAVKKGQLSMSLLNIYYLSH